MSLPARDEYDRAYAEKLWYWIPEVYRTQDLLPPANGALRRFVEGLAKEAAGQRRAIDRLWDDMLIPFADDWAVEHIGALLGTRMLSPLNSRGRRLDVAKTITYRRSAGTPWLMEELVHDITGWHGALVEGFATLARHPHNYDPDARHSSGRTHVPDGHATTPRAGRANLRRAAQAAHVDGAFDPFYHRPDLRGPVTRAGGAFASSRGRHDIGRLNLHIYRQKSYRVIDSTPYRFDAHHYALDPSGRALTLFKEGKRPFSRPDITPDLDARDVGRWSAPQSWQIPMPLECREFNSARYRPTLPVLPDPIAMRAMRGVIYDTLADLRRDYDRYSVGGFNPVEWSAFVAASLQDDSPKAGLYGADAALYLGVAATDTPSAALPAPAVQAVDFTGQAIPSTQPGNFLDEVMLHVDPATGRIRLSPRVAASDRCFAYRHHYGAFGDIGAGPYLRARHVGPPSLSLPQDWRTAEHFISLDGKDFADILDNATEPLAFHPEGSRTSQLTVPDDTLTIRTDLHLAAEPGTRAFLRLEPDAGTDFTIEGAARPGDPAPCLVLDGLWLGLRPATPVAGRGSARRVAMTDEALPPAPETRTLVLDGTFDTVVLRNVTLDPGGDALRLDPDTPRHIPAVRLLIRGYVSKLIIENSVTGPLHEPAIRTAGQPADPCSVTLVAISDSIVQAQDSEDAISFPNSTVRISRSTVFGDTTASRLSATETLFDGTLNVADTAGSCLRFSALGGGTDGREARYPRPYESHVFAQDTLPPGTFVSRRFGDAGFGQLALTAPPALLRGAENTSEMGAFHREMSAILLDDLKTKIDEFRPIQTLPHFILET